MKRLLNKTLLLTFLFCLAAINVQSDEVQKRLYLPRGSVDTQKLIGPPPDVGSEEYQKQIFTVLWLQQTRTPSQVAFVREKLNFKRYEPILGDSIEKVNIKVLRDVMASIISEVRDDYDGLKAEYDYPRPFVADDAVKPATSARPVGSYPSGHAVRGVVYARILGEIFPDKKEQLMQLGLQIGYGRAVAGVHYPMDIVAGQKLGNAYSDVIIAGPLFKEKLDTISR